MYNQNKHDNHFEARKKGYLPLTGLLPCVHQQVRVGIIEIREHVV